MLRKVLIWAAGIFAILVVLIVLFYAEEDWRGASDWAACQKELQAKGEILDLRQLCPPGKPEDDLSKVPIFAELYQKSSDYQHEHQFETYVFHWDHSPPPARINNLNVYLNADKFAKHPNLPDYTTNTSLDLASWQKFYRTLPKSELSQSNNTPAQDILLKLSRFNSDLREIDVAVSNPRAYWPIDYNKPFVTNLDGNLSIVDVVNILALRGVAHLENHEIDLAKNDYLFCFRLNGPLTKGCFLTNFSVISFIELRCDLILREGLRRHTWNDLQLHEIESTLASIDMLALAVNTLRIERACGAATIDFIEKGNSNQLRTAAGITDFDKYGYYDAIRLLDHRPVGEWDEDKCFYIRAVQNRIEALHPDQGTMDISTYIYEKDWALKSEGLLWSKYLSAIQLSGIDRFGAIIAKAETYQRLARLACRLEEYYLVHKQYPEKLDKLPDLPPHLNQEVLSEQPLHYQRKGAGYLLYSFGWNQKDDGGIYSAAKREGDWVWPSP